MPRSFYVGVALLAGELVWCDGAASAQTLPLVTEHVVDLGRFSDPPASDVLAAGSMVSFGTANAADAAVNPAAIVRGTRGDFVVSISTSRVSRGVFMRTTALSTGGMSPVQEVVSGPWREGFFAAAAVRRPLWAAAGFYDGSTRLQHRFATDDRVISQVSSPGGIVFSRTSGRTTSSLDVRMPRIGGAFALAPASRRFSAGVTIEAVNCHLDASSSSDLDVLSVIRPQPPATTRVVHTSAVEADEWKTGVTLAATFAPVRPVTISVARRWAPTFAARLSGENRYANSDFIQPFEQLLTLDAPDRLAIGAALTVRSTKIGFEIARLDYAVLPTHALVSPGSFVLESPTTAVEPRAAIRQGISITGSWRLALSAGVWREGIHALSSNAADPFVPVAERRTWLTGGVALEGRGVSIGVASGGARQERRVIVSAAVGVP